MNKQNTKSLKAEITVVFKTCNLMCLRELLEKYHGDIEEAVKDVLSNYHLFEIVDDEFVILNIKEHKD